jgi:hypothetical protein
VGRVSTWPECEAACDAWGVLRCLLALMPACPSPRPGPAGDRPVLLALPAAGDRCAGLCGVVWIDGEGWLPLPCSCSRPDPLPPIVTAGHTRARAGLWVAGPGPLIFAWWCWEVLRPPSWRKPPGIKGLLPFVVNLPSRSLEEA